MKRSIGILIFGLLVFTGAAAQRYDMLKGDFKNLKGITACNVVFDYSKLTIHGYESVEAYITEKKNKRLDHGHEEAAENFEKNWKAYPTVSWEPGFIAYFNDKLAKDGLALAQDPNLPHTMHIQITWIYPGYAAGPITEPAKLTAIVTVYPAADPSNVLASVEFKKVIGIESEMIPMDLGGRILGAYQKLAKNLTIQLKRFL